MNCCDNSRRRERRSSPSSRPRHCYSVFLSCVCIATIVLLSLLLTFYIFYLETATEEEEVCQSDQSFYQPDSESPLILTPLIRDGQLREARILSAVRPLRGVPSYSGYFTVNQTYNANLFFWFFPFQAEHKSESNKTVPLYLYLQGGPGLSSLFGLFLENGPFYLDDDRVLRKRKHSWTNSHHVLYIDSPVGTGFSFADNNETYAKVQEDVSRDLYTALVQFFKLFPEFKPADFYIAGTSYSGKYIPTIAYKIHQENQKSSENFINLKGMAIGSGYFEGRIQDEYSDFYFHLGLLDSKQRDEFRIEEAKIKELAKNQEFSKAREVLSPLILYKLIKYTGFDDIYMYNGLHPHTPDSALNFEPFLDSKCIRSALHVGHRPYVFLAVDVYTKFADADFYTSPKVELEALLDANYKVLLFTSQFDLIVTHVGVSKFIETLEWKGRQGYSNASRHIWHVNQTIAGYVKKQDNLLYVMIRNAGHMGCYDQPEWCEDMITKFASGEPFQTL